MSEDAFYAFIGGLGEVLAAIERYHWARSRLKKRLRGGAWGSVRLPFNQLPLQPGEKVVLVVDVEGEITLPLSFFAFGSRHFKRVVAEVKERKVEVSLEGAGLSCTLAQETPVSEVAVAALVHRALLQRGVDIFRMIEERVGRPGLFDELRSILELAASFLSDGASREGLDGNAF
ncbi:MAG: hypothetical protein QXR12_05395 [Thermofilum sp.]